MWTLIRLILEEQSDLGPHCLQKWLLKLQADEKQNMIDSLRVKTRVLTAADNILKIFIFIVQSKSDPILHVNCLLHRGFTSNIKT